MHPGELQVLATKSNIDLDHGTTCWARTEWSCLVAIDNQARGELFSDKAGNSTENKLFTSLLLISNYSQASQVSTIKLYLLIYYLT